MTGKRYYQKDYDEKYYIFDSKTLPESEFDERVEYDGYDVFADSLTGSEIIGLLNENEQLKKENKELKFDNDIKFWKLQFMEVQNSTQLIMHELSLAIDAGYTISDDFQKYLDGLKEQNKKNIEKAERLGI